MAGDSIGRYKATTRGGRTMHKDNTYVSGMYYTDTPIDTGFNKRIVNFVFEERGTILKTRAPLVLQKAEHAFEFSDNFVLYKASKGLFPAKYNVEYKDYFAKVLVLTRPSGDNNIYDIVDSTEVSAAAAKLGQKFDASKSKEIWVVSYYTHTDFMSKFVMPIMVPYYVSPKLVAFNNIPFATLKYMEQPLVATAFNGQIFALGFGYKRFDSSPDDLYVTPQIIFGPASWGKTDPFLEEHTILRKPKALYPSEGATDGYNMLANNPYRFVNQSDSSVITLTGLVPYGWDNNILLNPKVNERMKIRVYYDYAGTDVYTRFKFKFEWKDVAASTWNLIKEVSTTPEGDLRVTFTNPGKAIQIRCTAIDVSVNPIKEMYTLPQFFDFTRRSTKVPFANHMLAKATKIAYWRNRIILYGVNSAMCAFFASDINDPTYFPYPQNFEEFNYPILRCIEYGDSLMVFTEKEVWMIDLNPDGLTWKKSLVQAGLTLSEEDSQYITVLKNFIVFKQGNYFYMIVPFASTASSLAITNISEPIAELLDDMQGFVAETLRDVHDYTGTFELHKVQTYCTVNDIHIALSFNIPSTATYFNLVLIYNSLSRAWMVHTFETEDIYVPYFEDSQKYSNLYTLQRPAPDADRVFYALTFDEDSKDTADQYGVNFKNHHLLDTGYRSIVTHLLKRFREVQYQVQFIENTTFKFSTEYWVDNMRVKAPAPNYTMRTMVNPKDPTENILSLDYAYSYDTPVSLTIPEINNPMPFWEFAMPKLSAFLHWRIRYYGTGTGEAPRFILRSRNEKQFKLLEDAFVYRLKNARGKIWNAQ